MRRHAMGVVIALVVSLLASGGTPAAADSTAAQVTKAKSHKAKLKRASVSNELDGVRVELKIKKLARTDYTAVKFDTGSTYTGGIDSDDSGPDWFAEVFRKRNGKARVRWYRAGTDGSRAPCPGANARFKTKRGKLTVFVPAGCFGLDVGMVRATVEVYPRCDTRCTPVSAQTRVLQQGPLGAPYNDVNGDGKPDTIQQTSSSAGTYTVTVGTGTTTLTASAPRDSDVAWQGRQAYSSLDIDHDGDAEVIGTPADTLGDGTRRNLFTVVGGQLRLVRDTSGAPFELWDAFAGDQVYRDWRCSASGLQTWERLGVQGSAPYLYTVRVTTWSFADGVARPVAASDVSGIHQDFVDRGNWSSGSCLTS